MVIRLIMIQIIYNWYVQTAILRVHILVDEIKGVEERRGDYRLINIPHKHLGMMSTLVKWGTGFDASMGIKLKMVDMKLYRLNPNTWGSVWYVMSDSKEKALKLLIDDMRKEHAETIAHYRKMGVDDDSDDDGWVKTWEAVDVNDPTTFPKQYTLDEFDVGQVIRAEYA